MRDDPNDLVPEETDHAYSHLLTALWSASQHPEPITPTEQAAIITRVRERLASAPSSATAPDAHTLPRRSVGPGIPRQRPGLITGWGGRALVALGVLAIITVSSWALYKAAPFSHGGATQPTTLEPAPTAQTQYAGLKASLRVVIAGPYFLGELLPVDVSLANQTGQAVQLAGLRTTATLCHGSALMVRVTGGSDPSFTFPSIARACDNVLPITQIQPGEMLTIHQYVPLTRSGAVTLNMQSDSLDSPIPFAPLAGHWPSVQLQVQLQTPHDRALALHSQPGRVTVETPAGAEGRLLYMQSVSCGYNLGSETVQWTPLATNVLEESSCPTAHPLWEYIVSAPGFSIVSGHQQA